MLSSRKPDKSAKVARNGQKSQQVCLHVPESVKSSSYHILIIFCLQLGVRYCQPACFPTLPVWAKLGFTQMHLGEVLELGVRYCQPACFPTLPVWAKLGFTQMHLGEVLEAAQVIPLPDSAGTVWMRKRVEKVATNKGKQSVLTPIGTDFCWQISQQGVCECVSHERPNDHTWLPGNEGPQQSANVGDTCNPS